MKGLEPRAQPAQVTAGADALLPATRPVGAAALLVVSADGGRLAVGQVVREQALASFPTHAVHEVPGERAEARALRSVCFTL